MAVKAESAEDLIVRLATQKPVEFWGVLLAREQIGTSRVELGGEVPDIDISYASDCRKVLTRRGISEPQGVEPNETLLVLVPFLDEKHRYE